MKKRLAFILVAFGILGFSLGNEVLAADTAPASATMATDSDVSFYNGELLKKYLAQSGDRLYFDYDKAIQDKVSDGVIDMGFLVETISEDYSQQTFTPRKYFKAGWQLYGNYCGPGHNGNHFTLPVIDVLDQGCQNHDSCYRWGAGIGANCECNRQLVNYIKVYRRWVPAHALGVADAIRVYFETVGAIGC